jgi:hypothetical protein
MSACSTEPGSPRPRRERTVLQQMDLQSKLSVEGKRLGRETDQGSADDVPSCLVDQIVDDRQDLVTILDCKSTSGEEVVLNICSV